MKTMKEQPAATMQAEVKKSERVLLYEDHERINDLEKLVLEKSAYLNSMLKIYLNMEIGKPTLQELQEIMNMADDRFPEAKTNVKKLLAKKASKTGEVFGTGKRAVPLAEAIEKGLYDLPGFEELYSEAVHCKKVRSNNSQIVFSSRFLSIENDKVIVDGTEMQKFKDQNCKYITSEADKEKHELLNIITDVVNKLHTDGFITDRTELLNLDYFEKKGGQYAPKYKRLF